MKKAVLGLLVACTFATNVAAGVNESTEKCIRGAIEQTERALNDLLRLNELCHLYFDVEAIAKRTAGPLWQSDHTLREAQSARVCDKIVNLAPTLAGYARGLTFQSESIKSRGIKKVRGSAAGTKFIVRMSATACKFSDICAQGICIGGLIKDPRQIQRMMER